MIVTNASVRKSSLTRISYKIRISLVLRRFSLLQRHAYRSEKHPAVYICTHMYAALGYFHNRCQFSVTGVSFCVVNICGKWFKAGVSNMHSACQS